MRERDFAGFSLKSCVFVPHTFLKTFWKFLQLRKVICLHTLGASIINYESSICSESSKITLIFFTFEAKDFNPGVTEFLDFANNVIFSNKIFHNQLNLA